MQQQFRPRQRGSVRFAPYYKVQWFDEVSLTWRDIQESYPTAEAARNAYVDGRRCRVMVISPEGRRPVGH
jgi:hypothetical protein